MKRAEPAGHAGSSHLRKAAMEQYVTDPAQGWVRRTDFKYVADDIEVYDQTVSGIYLPICIQLQRTAGSLTLRRIRIISFMKM